MTKHYPYNENITAEQPNGAYISLILKVKKALNCKNLFERRERLKFWNNYLFDETPKQFSKDISNWKNEIQKEILGHSQAYE